MESPRTPERGPRSSPPEARPAPRQEAVLGTDEVCVGPLTWTEFSAAALGLAKRLMRSEGRSPHDAEDLLLDTYGRLVSKDVDWAATENPEAFVRTTMTRLFIDQQRARRTRDSRLPTVELDAKTHHVRVPGAGVADLGIAFELRDVLVTALRSLSPGQKEWFLAALDWELGTIDRATHAEIGEELGISEAASRRRLGDARKVLMQALGELRRGGGYE